MRRYSGLIALASSWRHNRLLVPRPGYSATSSTVREAARGIQTREFSAAWRAILGGAGGAPDRVANFQDYFIT